MEQDTMTSSARITSFVLVKTCSLASEDGRFKPSATIVYFYLIRAHKYEDIKHSRSVPL